MKAAYARASISSTALKVIPSERIMVQIIKKSVRELNGIVVSTKMQSDCLPAQRSLVRYWRLDSLGQGRWRKPGG